jgi:hypothetical protein
MKWIAALNQGVWGSNPAWLSSAVRRNSLTVVRCVTPQSGGRTLSASAEHTTRDCTLSVMTSWLMKKHRTGSILGGSSSHETG